ncbi:uncharacterized protein DUF903 [Roseimicrobium gellanilyticum]|uniref:Uncharacterized protein DUF903 n=2 Tax=Roseimicrobium gellanilyticum TaxID=748857 RepID=A0A366HNG1_9BACT|nr:uncharacterized protein DUF903 [Roseimicrobium gellanilyticum]
MTLSVVAGAREQFYGSDSGNDPMIIRLCLALTALAMLACAGCSSSHYKITLRDGREFMTASKPEYNSKTGYYKFRALNDKDALIRSDEILMMNEL